MKQPLKVVADLIEIIKILELYLNFWKGTVHRKSKLYQLRNQKVY